MIAWYGHKHVLNLLPDKGADPEAFDNDGQTALMDSIRDAVKPCAWS